MQVSPFLFCFQRSGFYHQGGSEQGFYQVHKQLSTDFSNKGMTGGVKHSFYYSSKYTENQSTEFISKKFEGFNFSAMTLEIKALLDIYKMQSIPSHKSIQADTSANQGVGTCTHWDFILWVCYQLPRIRQFLESGRSFSPGKLKSESQQVLVCLLPALCEKKKKKWWITKRKKAFARGKENKKSIKKMERQRNAKILKPVIHFLPKGKISPEASG